VHAVGVRVVELADPVLAGEAPAAGRVAGRGNEHDVGVDGAVDHRVDRAGAITGTIEHGGFGAVDDGDAVANEPVDGRAQIGGRADGGQEEFGFGGGAVDDLGDADAVCDRLVGQDRTGNTVAEAEGSPGGRDPAVGSPPAGMAASTNQPGTAP